MNNDNTQIRTPDTEMLLGYRALLHGQKGIAIMSRSKDNTMHSKGFITQKELEVLLNTGPFVTIDN